MNVWISSEQRLIPERAKEVFTCILYRAPLSSRYIFDRRRRQPSQNIYLDKVIFTLCSTLTAGENWKSLCYERF